MVHRYHAYHVSLPQLDKLNIHKLQPPHEYWSMSTMYSAADRDSRLVVDRTVQQRRCEHLYPTYSLVLTSSTTTSVGLSGLQH